MFSHFQKNGQCVGKELADFSGPFANKDEKASCKTAATVWDADSKGVPSASQSRRDAL